MRGRSATAKSVRREASGVGRRKVRVNVQIIQIIVQITQIVISSTTESGQRERGGAEEGLGLHTSQIADHSMYRLYRTFSRICTICISFRGADLQELRLDRARAEWSGRRVTVAHVGQIRSLYYRSHRSFPRIRRTYQITLQITQIVVTDLSGISDRCTDHTDCYHGSSSSVQVSTVLIGIQELADLSIFPQQ